MTEKGTDNGHKQMVPDGSGLLYNYVDRMYKEMFERQLDILELVLDIAAPDKKQKVYSNLRSKILRVGNNALRDVQEEIKKYSVTPKNIVTDYVLPPEKHEKAKDTSKA